MRRIALACLLIFAFTLPAAAERRVALVLGNSAYKRIVALTNPRNDAEDVATSLRDLGFEVMIRTDVQRSEMSDVLKDFSRLVTGADTALVYYAGHALQYQGNYFLVPVDAGLEDEDAVRFDMMPAEQVRSILSKVSGVRILVFDACRNDPFTDKPVAGVPAPQGPTRGLTRAAKPQGTVIAFATAPFAVAEDGTQRNSPFTRAFLARLKEPGLEVAQLFRLVTKDVFDATGGRQTPEITISLLDDYYLNRTDSDQTFWSRIRFSDDPSDFRDFLSRFPSSSFQGDARFRLAALDTGARLIEDARRQDQARRKADEDRRAREEHEKLCLQEAGRIDGLAAAGNRGELQAIKGRADCPDTAARAERALALIAEREAADKARVAAEAAEKARIEACAREAGQIDAAAAAGKRADLQSLASKACAENKPRIEAGLAVVAQKEAEAAEKAKAEACQREAGQIGAAVATGKKADLQALAAKACAENKPRIEEGLAQIAQQEADLAGKARLEACRKEAGQIDAAAKAGKKADLQALAGKLGCVENGGLVEAALAQIAQQEADLAGKARLEACRKEAGQIDAAAKAGKKADLQSIAGKLGCAENGGLVETALADLGRREAEAAEKAKAEACAREVGQIDAAAAAGKKAELQALAGKACAENRGRIDTGLAQIAQKEAETAAQQARLAAEKLCTEEGREIERLRGLGGAGRGKLEQFSATMRCDALRPVVVAALEAPPVAVDPKALQTRMQVALDRVGCWPARALEVNDGTLRTAVADWLKARKEKSDAAAIALDEELLSRLEEEPGERICPLRCGSGQIEREGRCIARPVEKPKREQATQDKPKEAPKPETPKSEPSRKPGIMLGI